MSALKMAAGASSSVPTSDKRSTIYGTKVDMGTNDGGPSEDPAGSGKPYPPTC